MLRVVSESVTHRRFQTAMAAAVLTRFMVTHVPERTLHSFVTNRFDTQTSVYYEV